MFQYHYLPPQAFLHIDHLGNYISFIQLKICTECLSHARYYPRLWGCIRKNKTKQKTSALIELILKCIHACWCEGRDRGGQYKQIRCKLYRVLSILCTVAQLMDCKLRSQDTQSSQTVGCPHVSPQDRLCYLPGVPASWRPDQDLFSKLINSLVIYGWNLPIKQVIWFLLPTFFQFRFLSFICWSLPGPSLPSMFAAMTAHDSHPPQGPSWWEGRGCCVFSEIADGLFVP